MTSVLSIWNDRAEETAIDYELWYQTEHLLERIQVPGFLIGRRYQALDAPREFLTTYELAGPEVLSASSYLDRLNDPTELTRNMMKHSMRRFVRAMCDRRSIDGRIRGAVALTLVSRDADFRSQLNEVCMLHTVSLALAHKEVWFARKPTVSAVTAEASLRQTEETIDGCLLLEFLRPAPAFEIAKRLRSQFANAEVGVYGLLCQVTKEGDAA